MAKVLIIDDDRYVAELMQLVITGAGHEAVFALSLEEGLNMLAAGRHDIVFLDVQLPDGSGLKALSQIKKKPSPPEVIIITGRADPDGAELAVRNDAWDYIVKPLSREAILLPLKRALQYRETKTNRQTAKFFKRENIIGGSRQINNCLELVAHGTDSDAGVLITGETGSGKELFAAAIHANSRRSSHPFIIVDCAALPATLVESTLFGHRKGAFTGADRDHEGLIAQADGGTLFLDEIGELPISIQGAFLRVLQERCFRPVGARDEIASDFRLIAATNRSLDQMVNEGKFRQDLLFRIRSIVIGLPPLRDREGDIRLLSMHFMNDLCNRKGLPTKGFSPEIIEALGNYNWPGNVRELENCMRSMLAIAGDDPTLYPMHLPTYIRVKMARGVVEEQKELTKSPEVAEKPQPISGRLKDFREQVLSKAERKYLKNLMSMTQWKIQDACRISNLSRPRLYALLKKYAITRQD